MSNSKNSKIRLGVILLAVLSQSVLAIGTAPQNSAPTKGPAKPTSAPETPAPVVLPSGAKSATKIELDAIRTQNALAAERAKAMGTTNGMPSAGPSVPAMDARPIPVEATSGRGGSTANATNAANSARVTMVAGPQGQLAATILTAQGLVVAHVGDQVPGLGTIRSISISQVVVENSKGKGKEKTEVVSLPFAAEPTSNLIQSGAPTPGGTNSPGPGLLGGR
jgi:type IV pilus biogenesis protein PilP